MKMKSSVLFTIIPGALFIVPMFLFTSGFLSTLSFLQTPEHELWSVANIWRFYKNKVIKLIPFNLFSLAFLVFVMPYLGSGPIWQNYNKTVQPCNDYWWTNALFINNFYPTEYEQQCLGWNWFIPVYLQLNILLPFFILAYKVLPLKATVVVFGLIKAFFYILNIVIITTKDIGAMPFFNQDPSDKYFNPDFRFYSEIFMKPWFHFNSYF